jgi:hypothetical protein
VLEVFFDLHVSLLVLLGVLDARVNESGEGLVIMFVPELLQLLKQLSRLSCVENPRNAVGVDGMGWAGFKSQMCFDDATMTLELDEPAPKLIVALK